MVRGALAARLRAAGCVAAEEEAHELVAAAPDAATLEAWACAREQGEPLAWITGSMPFCDLVVHVDRGVFVPRLQSEELARRSGALLPAGGRAADLCTGAGAIAMALMARQPGALVVGVDIDARAVACARRNGVVAVHGDLGAALHPGVFDVVTAVAPYVPTGEMALLPADVLRYEPPHALDGGGDGLDLVRDVVGAARRLLRPGGWLVTEIGGVQDVGVRAALEESGFGDVTTWHDDDGDLRGIAARLAVPTGAAS